MSSVIFIKKNLQKYGKMPLAHPRDVVQLSHICSVMCSAIVVVPPQKTAKVGVHEFYDFHLYSYVNLNSEGGLQKKGRVL